MDKDNLAEQWKDILESSGIEDIGFENSSSTYFNKNIFQQKTSHKSFEEQEKQAKYVLMDEVARGGMGKIFKGTQTSLEREIAVKKLLDDADPDTKDKFIAESKITAFLGHPNIVPVYDLGVKEGEPELVMKLITGSSWKDLLESREGSFLEKTNLDKHLDILFNVCNAISFAHSKGIVHNDLKPGNVMVGEFGEVLVMDWGIAVSFEKGRDFLPHKDDINSPMGTPSYISPELGEGYGENVGPASDVYLLGGILYHILMGRPPHKGNILQILFRLYEGEMPEFSENVPEELKNICLKAMALEPEDRYQSVNEFKQAIRDYQEHRESIQITNYAEEILQTCEKTEKTKEQRNKLYDNYPQAIASFQQAINLWDQNKKAISGKYRAGMSYAKTALEYEDFGLAEAQTAKLNDNSDVQSLKTQIQQTREKKISKDISQRLSLICLLLAFAYIARLLVMGVHKILGNELQFTTPLEVDGIFMLGSGIFFLIFRKNHYSVKKTLNWAVIYMAFGAFCSALLAFGNYLDVDMKMELMKLKMGLLKLNVDPIKLNVDLDALSNQTTGLRIFPATIWVGISLLATPYTWKRSIFAGLICFFCAGLGVLTSRLWMANDLNGFMVTLSFGQIAAVTVFGGILAYFNRHKLPYKEQDLL